MKFVLNLLILTGVLALIKGQDFDHKNQAEWGGQCQLKSQSPIELNRFEALPAWGLPSLKLKNFNISWSKPAELRNDGHSADIQLPSDSTATITGGPLLFSKYRTESLHFHWGSKNIFGSEHVIDSERYSMEMHLVHRNTKYATMDEATQHPDGLCVLAILFKVNPNQLEGFNGLNPIVNSLPDIVEYNSSITLNDLVLDDLLAGIDIQKFFTYQGSLTTPPCSEVVTWIVFPEPIDISEEQIKAFRSIYDVNGDNLVNNFRYLQAKGNRQVYLHKF